MNQQLIIQIIEILIGTGLAGVFLNAFIKGLDKAVTAYVKGKHSETSKNYAEQFKNKAHDVVSYLERSTDYAQGQYRNGAISLLTDWAIKNNIPYSSQKSIGMLVDKVIQHHRDNNYSENEAQKVEAPTEDNRDQSQDNSQSENTGLSKDEVMQLIKESKEGNSNA